MTYIEIAKRINAGEKFEYGTPENKFYYGQINEREYRALVQA